MKRGASKIQKHTSSEKELDRTPSYPKVGVYVKDNALPKFCITTM